MLFQAIDFKVVSLQGSLGGINTGYLNVLFDYKRIFLKLFFS